MRVKYLVISYNELVNHILVYFKILFWIVKEYSYRL